MHITALLAALAASLGVSSATSTVPVAPPAHCVTISRSLYVGTSGPDVTQLQQFLGVKPTGFFGPITQSALTKWQVATKVVSSAKSEGAGLVGPKTRTSLRCAGSGIVPVTTPVIAPAHPVTATSSTSTIPTTSTSTIVVPASGGGGGQASQAGGGGGGGASIQTGPHCAPFTVPQPPAAQCKTGSWVVIEDEAGCPVQWDCSDPSVTE